MLRTRLMPVESDHSAHSVTIAFEDLLVAATALQIGFGAVTGNVGEGDAVACPRCIGDNTHTVRYWPGASA